MTTTTSTPRKPATKRTEVPPTVRRQPGASPALAELTGSDGPRTVAIAIELLHPHPSNPRRELGDLTELADSIRAHGVRQNLLVVPDPDDPAGYRLVIGHRRTAAARLAGVTTLPAVLDESLTDTDQLELMLLENLQRSDLSAIEEADAYQGLLDLGVDEAAIAKSTGRSRATVSARLRIRALPEKAREQVHVHQATLADADLLATTLARPEIASRPAVVQVLTENFGKGGFAHSVEWEVQRVQTELKRNEAIQELTDTGVTVVDAGQYGDSPKGVKSLRELTDKPAKNSWDTTELALADHVTCPGHVAWVDSYGNTHHGCQGWKANGHHNRYASSSKSDQSPAERRELIANNKAALAAQTVRRTWIQAELLARPKMPDDAAIYVAGIIQGGQEGSYQEPEMLHLLLTGDPRRTGEKGAAPKSIDEAMRRLVAIAAARVEAGMGKEFWQKGDYRRDLYVHHLQTLAAWGYELSDVEQLLVPSIKRAKAKA